MFRSTVLSQRIALLAVAVPCFAPAAWRGLQKGFTEPVGLLSDVGLGLLVFLPAAVSPRWLRLFPLLLWALFQAGAQELFAALHRLPAREDIAYLFDPTFMKNSTAGLTLNYPYFTVFIILSAVLAAVFPVYRPRPGYLRKGLTAAIALLLLQGFLSRQYDEAGIAARFNPLHWFIADAVAATFHPPAKPVPAADLPPGLRQLDLQGSTLLPDKGKARNVLIVTLEGITGLYHPEIREAMAVPPGPLEMKALAAGTADAMLIPDFITHSHQTIRGLYSILCGDFSKLSFETPKAFELQENQSRARECLPARMAESGWSTHFLQGAGLSFMGKDMVMPTIGFQEVHGEEWFTAPDRSPFVWGVNDPDFFRGAREYIAELQAADRPWMLTLLTVGTHQPYAAPEDLAAGYPSRKLATVALLDEAVAGFINGLRQDGVLEDTLVLITSDESHGAELADWVS
ncbi:MAG: LTA synthase family protein, partial [Desulfobulbaceae bacterium]|nr:LTA synthase family protein [Desulfobulbaceae bacterium]